MLTYLFVRRLFNMKILICDDDYKILEYCKHEINKRTKNIHSLVFTTNKNDFINIINNEAFDLLIMDICLNNASGIDLAFFAKQKFPNIEIIFITGFEKVLENIFIKVHPFAYVRKPLNINLLCSHIDNIDVNQDDKQIKFFSIQNKNTTAKIPFNEITYVESYKRKILIHTVNGIFQFYDKIDNVIPKFPNYFVHCHKSYLINLYYINGAIVNNRFTLINECEIPISRSKLIETTKAYLEFQVGRINE